MPCLKCKQKQYHNKLCIKHFMEQIEARARKEIRLKGLIKKGDVLVIKDPIAGFLVRKIMAGMPLKIIKSGKNIRNAKAVSADTLDDCILAYIMDFFGEKRKKGSRDKTKGPEVIRPFRTIKEDELTAFAKAAKVKFKKRKRTKREKEILNAIDKSDKKHPETKFSLLKSVEEIRLIIGE